MSKELLKQNIEKAQFEIDRKKDMIKSTISFSSIIPIVDFGTVCIGGMQSVMTCFIGSICR